MQVLLGRAEGCDVRIDSLEYLTMVSRRHCVFTCKRAREGDGTCQDTWHLEDLGSCNGTTVNGARLRQRKRVRLQDDDRIVIGSRKSSEVCYRLAARGAETQRELAELGMK